MKEILDLTALSKEWQEKVGNQRDAVTILTMTGWELYRQYLVKPHS